MAQEPRHTKRAGRRRRRAVPGAYLLVLLAVAPPPMLPAQVVDGRGFGPDLVISQSQALIPVSRGRSALVVHSSTLDRVSVANPEIAEAVIVSPQEIVVNGKGLGTTSLLVWDAEGRRNLYTVEVAVDATSLERRVHQLFPDHDIQVDAAGSKVFLSGRVSNPAIGREVRALVESMGVEVAGDLLRPDDQQVLLQVQFAEVSRRFVESLGVNEIRSLDISDPDAGDISAQSLSDGLVRLFLLGEDVSLDLLIQALRERSLFRTLAEPNLLVLAGEEASFLAGGEFPFPVVQGGDRSAVTIQFKEFGVRLNFRPVITPSGSVRLQVAPEVSSLDFSNGLSISGFRVPALRTRRASTHVQLRPGQHLAIAGLLNNTLDRTDSRIPILGDIPILGTFFRGDDDRQTRTELLVLVTPELIDPSDEPPELPVPEPELWDWREWLENFDEPESHR